MTEIKIKYSKKLVQVDDEDYPRCMLYNWYLHKEDRIICKINNKCINIARFILKSTSPIIDHKDRNIFNNCKSNLREATIQQNNANQNISTANTSGYKGVSWHKAAKQWRAYISYNNHYMHLGNYNKIKDAAIAYNNAAIKYFGEFAKINIIKD